MGDAAEAPPGETAADNAGDGPGVQVDAEGAQGNGEGRDIRCDNVSSQSARPYRDLGEAVAPRWARIGLFAMFCQGVQMFMSYDGGATPACLDTIQADMGGIWTQAEFGILGSMDKVGMTVTSIFWGRCLQFTDAKVLVGVGLLLNTISTAVFGSLQEKSFMYAAKFVMGATQSLQGVWATVWTVTMAPPEYKTMWLGLGAVSAGLGNGIGTAVAGFGTDRGLPYAFAFQAQALVLLFFWISLLPWPSEWLVMQLPSERRDSLQLSLFSPDNQAPPRPERHESSYRQLQRLWQNKVYCWSCVAISLTMFEVSGIQFLWIRIFVELWNLDKSWVTLMFLIVTGLGGGVGIAFGPAYIDKGGGFSAPPGVVKSLGVLQNFSVVGAAAGLWGILSLYGKLHTHKQLEVDTILGHAGDVWLWMIWASIFIVLAVRNAAVAALCGINIEVVPGELRTFASGTEMTLRNILGYAFGPLLPGLLMDALWNRLPPHGTDEPERSGVQLAAGLAFVLGATFLDFWVLGLARRAAVMQLAGKRAQAVQKLRSALVDKDMIALERAVAVATMVDLQEEVEGRAVVGMANEVIGVCHAHGPELAFMNPGVGLRNLTRDELQTRASNLDLEVFKLRRENQQLRLALNEAQRMASSNVAGSSVEMTRHPSLRQSFRNTFKSSRGSSVVEKIHRLEQTGVAREVRSTSPTTG